MHLQLQEEECKSRSLQASLAEQEVENRALQEQLRQKADQLEVARGGLEHAQLKLQQQAAEVGGRARERALPWLWAFPH